MKKSVIAGFAALSLLDIAAATPLQAQGANGNAPFTGFFAGLHAGGFDASSVNFSSLPYIVPSPPFSNDTPIPGRSDTFDVDGGLLGLQASYLFQFPSNIVIGIDGDVSALFGDDSASGSGSFPFSGDGITFLYNSKLDFDWQATLRGRLGFAAGNFLFYTTGGVAFLNLTWKDQTIVNEDDTFIVSGVHKEGKTLVGGVIGGGIDYAITPYVLIGVEYRYEDFGDIGTVPHGPNTGVQTGQLDDLDVQKVLFRVNWRLN